MDQMPLIGRYLRHVPWNGWIHQSIIDPSNQHCEQRLVTRKSVV